MVALAYTGIPDKPPPFETFLGALKTKDDAVIKPKIKNFTPLRAPSPPKPKKVYESSIPKVTPTKPAMLLLAIEPPPQKPKPKSPP